MSLPTNVETTDKLERIRFFFFLSPQGSDIEGSVKSFEIKLLQRRLLIEYVVLGDQYA